MTDLLAEAKYLSTVCPGFMPTRSQWERAQMLLKALANRVEEAIVDEKRDAEFRQQVDRFGVLDLKEQHKATWRDLPESYWFHRLMQEVEELGLSLANNHKDPPEWELKQIAAICLNWLEMRAEKEKQP